MGLGANTTGSRIILWSGATTTDWYGLGMASSKMVYHVSAASTQSFYMEGVSALTVSQTTTTVNTDLSRVRCITTIILDRDPYQQRTLISVTQP